MKTAILSVVAAAMLASGIAPAYAAPAAATRSVTLLAPGAQPNDWLCYVMCRLTSRCCR